MQTTEIKNRVFVSAVIVLALAIGGLYLLLDLSVNGEDEFEPEYEPLEVTELTEPQYNDSDNMDLEHQNEEDELVNSDDEFQNSDQPYTQGVEDESSQDEAFIDSEVFTSVDELNQFFSPEDGVVIEQNLEDIFSRAEFDELIYQLKILNDGEMSEYNEARLSDHIYDHFANEIFDESFACAGKVCALTLKTTTLQQEEIEYIETYTGHYVFIQNSENEHGESVYNVIFIATSDPSKMLVK